MLWRLLSCSLYYFLSLALSFFFFCREWGMFQILWLWFMCQSKKRGAPRPTPPQLLTPTPVPSEGSTLARVSGSTFETMSMNSFPWQTNVRLMEADQRIAPMVVPGRLERLSQRMHITWNSAIGREELRSRHPSYFFKWGLRVQHHFNVHCCY